MSKSVLRGTLPKKNIIRPEAREKLQLIRKQSPSDKLSPPLRTHSPYLKYIKAGAGIYPRCFWFVWPVSSPYSINRERPALETNPEVQKVAKKPWHNVRLQGEVEAEHIYTSLLGRQLLPFGFTCLSLVVLPWKSRSPDFT